MIGFNGGLIGAARETSANQSVPGVWTPREQLKAKRASLWPLDLYSIAAAAYSLRQLLGNVTNVVRVRRDNDGTESDFTAAQVSDGTLTAWVGAGNNGFVRTWYDQSGNGNDATQATSASQPKIVDASSGLVTESGKTAISFDNINDYLVTATASELNTTTLSLFSVSKHTGTESPLVFRGTGGAWEFLQAFGVNASGGASTTESRYRLWNGGGTSYAYSCNINTYSLSSCFVTPSSINAFLNNQSVVNNSRASAIRAASQPLHIGAYPTSSASFNQFFGGTAQEIIIYPSDQSANRVTIEANINAHYNIY